MKGSPASPTSAWPRSRVSSTPRAGSGPIWPTRHEAVDLLGYRHDVTASTLRARRPPIGERRPDHRGRLEPVLLRGAPRRRGHRAAHHVLTFVGSSDEVEQRERELAEAFAARGVDGLVSCPAPATRATCSATNRPASRSSSSTARRVFCAGYRYERQPRRRPHCRRAPDSRRPHTDRVPGRPAFGVHRHRAPRGLPRRARRRGHAARSPALERLGLADSEPARQATGELFSAIPTPRRRSSLPRTSSPSVPSARFGSSTANTTSRSSASMTSFLVSSLNRASPSSHRTPTRSAAMPANCCFAACDGVTAEPQTVVLPTKLIPRGSGEIAPESPRDDRTP